MQMESELKQLKKEISKIRRRQEYLEDALLSAEDVEALKEAREDLAKGRTVPLEKVKGR